MTEPRNVLFVGVQRPPRWTIVIDDPDGPQKYVGEGLEALQERLRDFDPAEIRHIYISD